MSIGAVAQDGQHGVSLQQLGDRLHLVQCLRRVVDQAVVDMIVDERPLGRGHSTFHRRQLAGDVEAGLLSLDHADDMAQMTFGTFQPGDEGGVGCVNVRV